MKDKRYLFILFFGIFLILINPEFPYADSFKEQSLDFQDVNIEFLQEQPIPQGKKAFITYQVKNISEDYLLFGHGRTVYGRVYKDGEQYNYDGMAQQESLPVFFTGWEIIKPGEVKKIKVILWLVEFGTKMFSLDLEFFKFSKDRIHELYLNKEEKREGASYIPMKNYYSSAENITELDNAFKQGSELLVPMDFQKENKKQVKFKLSLDIEKDAKFQRLYEKYQPRHFIELSDIGRLGLATAKGTILITKDREIDIGGVDLSALERIDGLKDDTFYIWVGIDTGPIKDFLKKYGKPNDWDQMYHGNFSYFLKLPRKELLDFFKCIKEGKYLFVRGSGLMYSNDLWLLGK
ncbi:MAG: hypothetical protein JW827_11175 [Spirochaetes bacterium]|nr:hypothetical protein [Spirochaetota bacterium]